MVHRIVLCFIAEAPSHLATAGIEWLKAVAAPAFDSDDEVIGNLVEDPSRVSGRFFAERLAHAL